MVKRKSHIRTVLAIGLFLLLAEPAMADESVVINTPLDGTNATSPLHISVVASGNPTSLTVTDNGKTIINDTHGSSIQTLLHEANGTHVLIATATYFESNGYQRNRRSNLQTSVTDKVTVTIGATTPPVTTPPVTTPPVTTPPVTTTPVTTPVTSTNEAAQIANDMAGKNEDAPHGVPSSWDFYSGPTMGDGNKPPSGWTASTAWGVIYIGIEGSPATNTRVNIRNQQLFFLSKSVNQWQLLQSTSKPDGAAYLEDFSGDASIPPDVRTEADGTISVNTGTGKYAGYIYHFYPSARGPINPNDVGGVISCFDARLIVGDPSLPDDRASAHFLAESGADYWPSLNGALPASYGGVTPPVAGGKFKYVQTEWRSFCMTTLTSAQLTANLPPIDFTGIAP